MMQQFAIGSGFSAHAVTAILGRWMQSAGIHANARVGKRPAVHVMHQRLSGMFGAARFGLHRGSLYVQKAGKWELILHRDDVGTFLYGHRLPIKVGKEPDPLEQGVKVQVGIMEATVKAGLDKKLGTSDDEITIRPKPKVVEYYELDDGGFECSACGKVYRPTSRAEEYVKKHIAKEH